MTSKHNLTRLQNHLQPFSITQLVVLLLHHLLLLIAELVPGFQQADLQVSELLISQLGEGDLRGEEGVRGGEQYLLFSLALEEGTGFTSVDVSSLLLITSILILLS